MTERNYRDDFPQLSRLIHGKPLTYLDSGATTLKPQSVIDRLSHFYAYEYGTVRRGVYLLSQEATQLFEGVRAQTAQFLNASAREEIVFVRGVTEGINLLARSLSESILSPGDEILISEMEHHANIVPWYQACQRTGAKLVVAPVDDRGVIDMDALRERVTARTKIISIVHVSNALGTVNPVEEIAQIAKKAGAVFIVDGAQSAPHLPVDVKAIDCDFYVFSAHKLYGPSGVGALYGKAERLAALPPFLGGGEMIQKVSFEEITWEDAPHRFEAGTPQIAEVIGMGAAIDYLTNIGMDVVAEHDAKLLAYCTERMAEIPNLRIIGTAPNKSGLVAFVMDGIHPFDIGTLLDREGVCVRVGTHCAQPIQKRFGTTATARASFGIYNTEQDIDILIDGLKFVAEMFA